MYKRNTLTMKIFLVTVSVLILFVCFFKFKLYFGYEKRQLITGHEEEKRKQIYMKTLSKKYNSVK